jgi:hypothetical protein
VTAPFVAGLRVRPEVIRIDGPGPVMTIRVEMPEVWDAIRIDAPVNATVMEVKIRALQLLYPGAGAHEEYVMKLRGFEVLDEFASLMEAGAIDGSIFLLTSRRRRPVR